MLAPPAHGALTHVNFASPKYSERMFASGSKRPWLSERSTLNPFHDIDASKAQVTDVLQDQQRFRINRPSVVVRMTWDSQKDAIDESS